MGRLHLVELEDLPWVPSPIRNALTGYLQAMIDGGDAYGPVAPRLAEAIAASGATRIVDLCSGGGGPWRRMRAALAAHGVATPIVLTDLYPNPGAIDGAGGATGALPVSLHPAPVDATRVPEPLGGMRTLFTAFHHFAPERAREVLRDAVMHRAPIAIFEATKRNATCLFVTLLTPILTLLVMPRVRPFRWSNLLFTYLLPVVPLMVLWDGVVSCLRTYDVEELRQLAREADPAARYDWTAGEVHGRGPIPVTYLVGMPSGG